MKLKLLFLAGLMPALLAGAQVFRVATFNVENYVEEPGGARPLKSSAARAKVCESIAALKPDVVALQEMGDTNALLELQGSLKKAGLDLPFWDHVSGHDTNIHLALLSRFPIVARRPHVTETFLLGGRRFHVSRGFAEVEVQVNPHYRITLIAAHLKSQLPSAVADEEEMRDEEAADLRRIIDARLAADPEERLIVLGDLNDVKDSRAIKTILGHGRTALFDTRPAERAAGASWQTADHFRGRQTTWTDYFAREDIYSRIDYILISHALEREWLGAETYVLNLPDWGVASDHRPLVAGFRAAPAGR